MKIELFQTERLDEIKEFFGELIFPSNLNCIGCGESIWNKENRFTGWTDVDLTPHGVSEAIEAGELLRHEGFRFEKAFTSYLKRANKTLNVILDKMDLDYIPVETLRQFARTKQSRDSRQVRRRTGTYLATQLQHTP